MMKKVVLVFFSIFFVFFMFSCDFINNEETKELQNIEISSLGKTEYNVGDDLDVTGFVIDAIYNTETVKVDLELGMCDITKFSDAGNKVITVTYNEKTTTFNVVVHEKADEITKIEIIQNGEINYSSETPFDLSEYIFKLTYESGKVEEVLGTDTKLKANPTNFEENEDTYTQKVTISYGNVSCEVMINVLNEWDYEDYIEEKEINELLLRIESDCAIKIPSETTENITLPQISDYNYKLKLSWLSSNTKVISVTGVVSPKEEDETVTLSLDVYKIGSSKVLKHFDFDVFVKGLGPIDFPDLTNKKVVMAYFYEGTYREMPARDGNRIDIMCYCFGRVDNGKLSITGLGKINTVMKWRRDYKMRILLSIGGGASGGFSGAVKDDASRKIFVDSIMDVIKEYGFDGIDMDWEYPGWSGLSDSTPYDVINFSYLLRDLRAAMDEYKSGLLLTAAVISSSTDKFYQPKELNKYLDYVNIMTYDGDNSGIATHHTKPYGSGYSAKNAIEAWINAGVDAKKIVVGAAFYGKISELTTPVSNPEDALGKSTKSRSTITYSRISSEYLTNPAFKECYDVQSGAFYLSDGKYFITYDNYDSILKKAELVREYNLGGMMFWDYGSDNTGLLLSAVSAGIKALNN